MTSRRGAGIGGASPLRSAARSPGYSVIGSARNAMAPTSVRMIERTAAKIGRSTKKCENRMLRLVSGSADRPANY